MRMNTNKAKLKFIIIFIMSFICFDLVIDADNNHCTKNEVFH